MTSEEPRPLSSFAKMKALLAVIHARKAWEAANSEPLCSCHPQGHASAWTEALQLDDQFERRREQEARAAKVQRDLPFQLHKLGVPKRAAGALLAMDADRPGPRAVRAWFAAPVTSQKPLLVLLGEPGTGKTVAAAEACRLSLATSHPTLFGFTDPAVWVACAELANLSSFTDADRAWFERMQSAWLLVLDDLGTEQLHAQAQQRLERLIDERYGNNRRTVITSNASKEAFQERVGARITDRIREAGRVVNCGNVSLRRAK
jgi:hypothetical protein